MRLDQLGDAQRLTYMTARRFAETELLPEVTKRPGDQSLVRWALPRLAEIGLLGATFPVRYGGAESDYISYCLLCEAVGAVSPSVFTGALTVQLSLVGTAVHRFGKTPQHEDVLRSLLTGKTVGAFALTEPDAGSDPAAGVTRATKTADGWTMNGSKLWISNGTVADVLVVFAQTEPGSRHRGMVSFLIPADKPGITRSTIPSKLGLSESDTAAIQFDDVTVPETAMLGGVGEGFRIAQASLEVGRLSTAACAVGISQACLDLSAEYAKTRTQWGKPIAGHQLIQAKIAEMAISTHASRLMVHHAASILDKSQPAPTEAAMAKQFAAESAVLNARRAVALHGAVGYVDETRVGPLLRDAIGLSVYEGTSEIQSLLVARDVLGVSAFT